MVRGIPRILPSKQGAGGRDGVQTARERVRGKGLRGCCERVRVGGPGECIR